MRHRARQPTGRVRPCQGLCRHDDNRPQAVPGCCGRSAHRLSARRRQRLRRRLRGNVARQGDRRGRAGRHRRVGVHTRRRQGDDRPTHHSFLEPGHHRRGGGRRPDRGRSAVRPGVPRQLLPRAPRHLHPGVLGRGHSAVRPRRSSARPARVQAARRRPQRTHPAVCHLLPGRHLRRADVGGARRGHPPGRHRRRPRPHRGQGAGAIRRRGV